MVADLRVCRRARLDEVCWTAADLTQKHPHLNTQQTCDHSHNINTRD